MVQCEMCGAETPSPRTVKVEGAELEVCDGCAEFGTEVRTDSSSDTSTKYSTSSSGGSSTDDAGSTGGGAGSTGGGGSGGRSRGRDMFDDIEELAQDYDDRLRDARERRGLSQQELADDLNEKASLIRKLERGEVLPSDEMQAKLERSLDVSLSGGREADEEEWESDASTGEYTLGDVVQRKD